MTAAMSTVTLDVQARPEHVFAVLADGWSYASWVVGTAHIRQVDPGWPARGRRIHHSVGPWPVQLHDTSEVAAVDPPRRLDLHVRLWPAGAATVHFELTGTPDGCRVTMHETPTSGPLRWLPLVDLLLTARNRETLRRLADFARHREAAGQPAPPLDS